MALKDIFKMTKANRYTADGREELIKAQEAETEDRRYNIGEISEKTGLQKTANGWVKPKSGKQPAKKDASGADVINNKYYKNDVRTEAGERKILSETKTEVLESKIKDLETLKKRNGGKLGVQGEKSLQLAKEELAKRNGGKESKPAVEKPKTEKKQSLKLPDEKSSFSTDVNRMKKLKKEDYKQYTIQLEKLHSKYPINKWKDLYNKTLNDSAPHVLTGDTRIRVKK